MDESDAHRSPSAAEDESKGEAEHWQLMSEDLKIDARRAAIGGGLAAAVALVGAWFVGAASGAEARLLLETSLPSTRSFCGTIIRALSTVLALMLTLLGLSSSADVELRWAHYQRVKQIAWIDAIVLTAAVLVYLLLNVPLGQADKAFEAPGWFAGLYYATLALASLLGGAVIAIVLMLYNAVHDIIQAIGPEETPDSLVRSEKS